MAGQHGDPVAERAVVLDVGHHAGLVVDLDVGTPVPVALAGHQSCLARVVGEHPARRVGDREREAAARSQHAGRLGDGVRQVRHELQGPEGAEDHVERRVGEGQVRGGAEHRRDGRGRSPRRSAGSAGAGGTTGPGPRAGHPATGPSASTGPHRTRPRARRVLRRPRARPGRPRCAPPDPRRSRCRRGTPRASLGTRRRTGPSRVRSPRGTPPRPPDAARHVRWGAQGS